MLDNKVNLHETARDILSAVLPVLGVPLSCPEGGLHLSCLGKYPCPDQGTPPSGTCDRTVVPHGRTSGRTGVPPPPPCELIYKRTEETPIVFRTRTINIKKNPILKWVSVMC